MSGFRHLPKIALGALLLVASCRSEEVDRRLQLSEIGSSALQAFKAEFNGASDSVRVILLLSPT